MRHYGFYLYAFYERRMGFLCKSPNFTLTLDLCCIDDRSRSVDNLLMSLCIDVLYEWRVGFFLKTESLIEFFICFMSRSKRQITLFVSLTNSISILIIFSLVIIYYYNYHYQYFTSNEDTL